MNKLFLALVCLGVLLGPVHCIYVRHWAGEVVLQRTVFGLTGRGGERPYDWMTPIAIKLDPGMNPIAMDFKIRTDLPQFEVTGETAFGGRYYKENAINYYKASLTLDGKVIWEKPYLIGYQKMGGYFGVFREDDFSDDSSADRELHNPRLAFFRVNQAGEYTFMMKETEAEEVRLRQLDLVVKRNAAVDRPGVYWCGAALAGLSLGILVKRKLSAPMSDEFA